MLVLEGVEECDDGNTDNNDGCSATCAKESCGDQVVQDSEECDDGKNGNQDDTCTDKCMKPTCGDEYKQATEECDDGNKVALDGCSETCKDEYLIFVTSQSYKIDRSDLPYFFGVGEADEICQSIATSKGFSGDYVAWLSDESTDAHMDLDQSRSIIRTDGEIVVDTGLGLITPDTPLKNPVDVDESGIKVGQGFAWTGTNAKGGNAAYNCNDWTTASEDSIATIGKIGTTDNTWTIDTMPGQFGNCSNKHHLYCFRKRKD